MIGHLDRAMAMGVADARADRFAPDAAHALHGHTAEAAYRRAYRRQRARMAALGECPQLELPVQPAAPTDADSSCVTE